MAKLKGTHHVVTASFTDTGAPAYLTASGSWSLSLQEAHAIESESLCGEMLQSAATQERLVSDPYSIMVDKHAGVLKPLSQRESIRALGPTTPLRRADA